MKKLHDNRTNAAGRIAYQVKTFAYAISGIRLFFKTELKASIHLAAAVAAIGLSIFFRINRLEWIMVTIAIGMVLALELINSAIERLANLINPKPDPRIGALKDISAGAVLIGALTALAIGLIIFIPKFLQIVF